MNGRNRSHRTQRQAVTGAYQVARHRQSRARYDRQRSPAAGHREWVPLPWQVMHRNGACLSVGGCY